MMAGMPVTASIPAQVTVRSGDLIVVGHVTTEVGTPRRAIVLVHGLGSSSRAFGRLVPRLAAHGQVHAVDLPGFGASPGTGRDVPIRKHAAALAEYVRAYVTGAGMPAPVLLGHSLGAQVVGQALADHPDVASAGVLLGPTSDAGARSLRRQAGRLAIDAVREPPRAVGVLLVDALWRCRPPYYLAQLRHVVGHRLEDVLPEVRVPVTLVRGHHDAVAPQAWTERLAASASLGEVRTVRGHHHAMDGDPDGLTAVVVEAWQAADREAL